MKLAAMTMAVMAMAAGAEAGQAGRCLTVYITGEELVPMELRVRGERIAARMFAGIGVQVEWRHREPANGQAELEQAVVIRIVESAPATASRDAAAAAFPFEGATVTLYYGSMKWAQRFPQLAPALFGHVLAHEIAHNLQRIERHSATGVMMARWTDDDYEAMRRAPLRFEQEDIMWIHKGLDARAAKAAPAGTGPRR